MSWAVVRVRGSINVKPKIKETMKLMRLNRVNHCVIVTAVRDGASSAQINLDGGRVSNRIQPPLAMNTRKYSV